MKKVIRTIALIAVFGTLAISCQKETNVEPTPAVVGTKESRTVIYSIDGTQGILTLNRNEEWNLFLNQMLALSEEGHTVKFRLASSNVSTTMSKEVVTYTTADHDAAYSWADKMVSDGYEVSITYDDDKQMYVCIAIK